MNASEQEKRNASEVIFQPESNRQPIWHVIVLHVFTMFGYSLVWFYKNCRQLSVLAGKIDSGEKAGVEGMDKVALRTLTQIHPALFTLALLVPVVQLVFATIFFRTVARLYPANQSLVQRCSWLVGFGLTGSMVGLLCLAALPGAFYLCFLAAAVPMAICQYLLNALWRSVESEDTMLRQAFSGGELAMLILGSVLLGLVVTGLVNM